MFQSTDVLEFTFYRRTDIEVLEIEVGNNGTVHDQILHAAALVDEAAVCIDSVEAWIEDPAASTELVRAAVMAVQDLEDNLEMVCALCLAVWEVCVRPRRAAGH